MNRSYLHKNSQRSKDPKKTMIIVKMKLVRQEYLIQFLSSGIRRKAAPKDEKNKDFKNNFKD